MGAPRDMALSVNSHILFVQTESGRFSHRKRRHANAGRYRRGLTIRCPGYCRKIVHMVIACLKAFGCSTTAACPSASKSDLLMSTLRTGSPHEHCAPEKPECEQPERAESVQRISHQHSNQENRTAGRNQPSGPRISPSLIRSR